MSLFPAHPLSIGPFLARWRCLAWCLLLLLVWPLAGQAQQSLVLMPGSQRVEAWPAVQVRQEGPERQTLTDVLASDTAFSTPTTAYGTLGLSKGPVWLRLPLHTASGAGGLWVLDINYPVLTAIDVYLVQEGKLLLHRHQHNLAPFFERRIPTPAHAFDLDLADGSDVVVYVRVAHEGALILPISLQKPRAFHQVALAEQMLQGLLTGLALCLLVYSLGQWIVLRDILYAKYALLITGSILFSLLHFGIGMQYLWGDLPWFETRMSGLSAMIAATGSFLFYEHVLRGPDLRPWISKSMRVGAILTASTGVAFALDIITIHTVTTITSTLGMAPALLAAPGAWVKARRGDAMGIWFLVAWLTHFVAAVILIEVIKGRIGVSWWTMHSYQIGATVDMLIFLRMLALRTQALHSTVAEVSREKESLRSLAHTDPLTSLLNRRGLQADMAAVVESAAPGKLVAVYMLDLDGFKPINDLQGHEVGDELLVAVADRLRGLVRSRDLVARMGGDEFVVLLAHLKHAEHAADMGQKLLDTFADPFVLPHGGVCRVGVTVGYALGPLDGREAQTLLRQADEAMYVGKRDGKRCVRRYVETVRPVAAGED